MRLPLHRVEPLQLAFVQQQARHGFWAPNCHTRNVQGKTGHCKLNTRFDRKKIVSHTQGIHIYFLFFVSESPFHFVEPVRLMFYASKHGEGSGRQIPSIYMQEKTGRGGLGSRFLEK